MIEIKEAQKLLSSLSEMINEYWFDMIIKRWQKLGYIKDNERQDLKLKECLDCNNYNTIICESCQNNAMFKKIQKPKVENINVDDMYIAEKKVDKLGEARNYRNGVLNNGDKLKRKAQFNRVTELYEQAIEQIIKEKDELKRLYGLEQDYNKKHDGMIDTLCKEIEKLEQKKPLRKCIEWLRRYIRRYDCSECAKELLKFLEKIK
jgi:hypothetical protein